MKLRDQMVKYVNISKKNISDSSSNTNLYLEIYNEIKIVTVKISF